MMTGLGLVVKNHKVWGLVVLLVICSGLFRKSFFNLSIPSQNQTGLRLVTHNIGSSLSGNVKPRWSYYKSLNADVLCFQEWNSGSSVYKTIKDSLERQYGHTTKRHNNLWPIFSKYPILDQGELKSSALGNGCTWADIRYGHDTIRIYNVHLVSNRISTQTEQLMQTKEIPGKNTWQKITRVMRRYKHALLHRANQADVIKEHMVGSPYAVVLVGDFNDIPSSYVYNLLNKKMSDAFLMAGNGLAYTYAGRLPFLHIDQVLLSSDLKCTSYTIDRVHYSDHFPVMTCILSKGK